MIKVLADTWLYELESMMPDGVDLHFFDPGEPFPAGPLDFDALLTRTVTPLNRDTLDRFTGRLRFAGTGTAGTDHVDTGLLKERGILFSDAAGCNARSVAEYVAVALLLWSGERETDLRSLTAGIVGAGYTGRAVAEILQPFGVSVLLHDPPREEREEQFRSAPSGDLLGCDVLTFHVPLSTAGPHPTFHWLGEPVLSRHPFRLVINTARGGVIDEKALLAARERGTVGDFVLDVWEDEPRLHRESAEQAFIATPHIAGYSRQAKRRASRIIAEAFCRAFRLEPVPHRPGESETVVLNSRFSGSPDIGSLVTELHPIRTYQRRLMETLDLPQEQRPDAFNRLRATFPLRQEFSAMRLEDPENLPSHLRSGLVRLFSPL